MPPEAFSNNKMDDSQAALRAMHYPTRPTSGQSLVRFLKSQIRRLRAETIEELFWTLGHEGVPLNEVADKATKLAASADGRKTTLPTSLANLLQATWMSLRVSSSDSLNYVSSFKAAAKKITDAFNGLDKGHAATIFQLRTRHSQMTLFFCQIWE
ncbi:hypothetical protein CROQUDRAFT_92299 [Cronartium quercuum f. sp. fusiforme G11]|uniref:RNase H type-1 domain-containing protein n=1 Tax=Cronartium quercuum f. sp. fusiforme G11 TaxID=708437 RepID=A0A9P6NNM0_9BASI|nr:hypothetical protein CROQUDRAFT_92299 [Cronartium quercuum f. sp. fusiforme G11]